MSRPKLRLIVLLALGLGCLAFAWRGRSSRESLEQEVWAWNRQAMLGRRQELFDSKRYRDDGFLRLSEPKPGEWLHSYPESGQNFREYRYRKSLRRTRPEQAMVFQLLEPMEADAKALIPDLRRLVETFFSIPTSVRSGTLAQAAFDPSRRQYRADALLAELPDVRPASDFLSVLVLDRDMVFASYNFVFGVGPLVSGKCVLSLHRLREASTPRATFLRRSAQILTHEMGHSLGMRHCVFYRCSMNGTISRFETDRAPLAFCPVCLHKLQYSFGFDVVERYARLEALYREFQLDDDADWIAAQRARMQASGQRDVWRKE